MIPRGAWFADRGRTARRKTGGGDSLSVTGSRKEISDLQLRDLLWDTETYVHSVLGGANFHTAPVACSYGPVPSTGRSLLGTTVKIQMLAERKLHENLDVGCAT